MGKNYPKAEKGNVVDDYFGVKVADPYRWLEDENSEETKNWVEAQREFFSNEIEKMPFRDKIRQRITELTAYKLPFPPFLHSFGHTSIVKNGKLYFTFSGTQKIMAMDLIKRKPYEAIKYDIDPDRQYVGISSFSPDGSKAAISFKEDGSDWTDIMVADLEKKEFLPERLTKVRYAGTTWLDGSGFYYTRFDEVIEEKRLTQKLTRPKLYYHKVGTGQEQDVLVLKSQIDLVMLACSDIIDEKYLLINEYGEINDYYLQEIDYPKNKIPIIENNTDQFSYMGVIGKQLIFSTNIDCPMGKVVMINPVNPKKENWQTIIHDPDACMENAILSYGKILVTFKSGPKNYARQYDLKGNFEHEIKTPCEGLALFYANHENETLYFVFSSFVHPTVLLECDQKTGECKPVIEKPGIFNPDDFTTKVEEFRSHDGKTLPVYIFHKKGLVYDGKRPTILYGYGSHAHCIKPQYSSLAIALAEAGGIYCSACIRGGGEYGEEWHKEGMLMNKKNTFSDFISCAEGLIKKGYTCKEKLAIHGASAGGMLVGACMTQRPDLFRVALPNVGIHDMLRYNKFTIGWSWTNEYGSSDDPEQFRYLLSYSPYHNINKGTSYPATMIITADHDNRVVPAHSYKFAAALQEVQEYGPRILTRIGKKYGHGASSRKQVVDQLADILSFTLFNMGEEYKM